jgi:hypothetical protein
MTGQRAAALSIIAVALAALGGCASEDSTGRFLVTPDKFVLYNCAQLSDAAQANLLRQQELEKLMAKAGTGPGTVVSDLAYRPEYVQLRGEMVELRKTSAEKNCKPIVYTAGRTSDQAVR